MATGRSHPPPSVAPSDAPSRVSRPSTTHTATPRRTTAPRSHPQADSKYSISAVLAEPHGSSSSLLPSLPTLPSASSYLPSQLSSLSTTFTSAGTLPRQASGAKSVAQRRSQAPPVNVTELRKVQRAEFDAYLREVGDDFERWQRESRLGSDGAAHLRPDGDDGHEGDGAEAGVGLGVRTSPSLAHSPALPQLALPSSTEVLPSLDDVPPIFFDPSFDLANPRTFDLVTERIQLSPHPSPNLSLPATSSAATSASQSQDALLADSVPGLGPHTLNDLAADQVLQDKLSHYTAVIESHLVREIGLRSSSFFAALSNLQSLHSEGQAALGKISDLQRALGAREGGVGATAQHGLQVLRAQARRRGLERIDEAVRAVEEVWTAVEGVKELVENGEWDGALEVSEQVEEAYYGSATAGGSDTAPSSPAVSPSSPSTKPSPSRRHPAPTRPLNLTKLRALSSLPSKLALLRAQVARSLEGELTSVLEHEMDVGIDEHVRLAREGRRWKGKGREVDAPAPAATGAAEGVRTDERDAPTTAEDLARERTLERVRPVVSALVRAGGMDSAVVAWRESVLREVRALVREHLPTAETPTAENEDHFAHVAVRSVSRGTSVDLGTISEKSVSLAKKLRALPHEAFVALARDTYAGLLACIEVVDLQARVLLELWSASREAKQRRRARRRGGGGGGRRNGVTGEEGEDAQQPAPPSPGSSLVVPGSAADLSVGGAARAAPVDSSRSSTSDDASTLATEIADVVHAVAELANVRFSKVIGVRTEVHAHLALADFVAVFDLSWSFVVACERVCQRMIVGLRGAMVSQAKTFLQTFHQRQITENARVVEEEQWAAAEVPPETQDNIGLIVAAATSDPPALLLGERRAEQRVAEQINGNGAALTSVDGGAESAAAPAAAREPAKQIDVEGRQFFAVSAGLITVAVLVEYLKVLANVPMLTTDAMSKIIEFMKVFNSRTCQVVLGAGAMRSAGLKNITAKHLALASQALSIMIALIPYIREAVRRHLNPKQAVMLTEFDKLKRDYQEHQHEIHAKLVAIMSDRLQVHSRSLENTNFEDPAPRGPDAPHAYMEALVKEHNTLHKVLSRFLATETVAAIMGQVFAALDERLGEVFARVEPKSRAAKDRMLVDVRYLRERLGELKGVEDNGPGKQLEAFVEAKHVPQAAPPPPAPAPAAAAPSQAPSPAPAADNKPSLPPRTSSMPPSSPSLSATAAAAPPPGVGQPLFGNARASTSSASLSSTPATAPQPPSPVPVPAALPPSPKPASPAPYVSQKKKKSLAERLAESMGRKVAHAEPETTTTPVQAEASTPASAEPVPAPTPAPAEAAHDALSTEASSSEPSAQPERRPEGELTPLALERAFENGTGVDTPALEKALQLEGIDLAPGLGDGDAGPGRLATPAREELEEIEKAVEREIARGEEVEEGGQLREEDVKALQEVAQEERDDAPRASEDGSETPRRAADDDQTLEADVKAADPPVDRDAIQDEPTTAPAAVDLHAAADQEPAAAVEMTEGAEPSADGDAPVVPAVDATEAASVDAAQASAPPVRPSPLRDEGERDSVRVHGSAEDGVDATEPHAAVEVEVDASADDSVESAGIASGAELEAPTTGEQPILVVDPPSASVNEPVAEDAPGPVEPQAAPPVPDAAPGVEVSAPNESPATDASPSEPVAAPSPGPIDTSLSTAEPTSSTTPVSLSPSPAAPSPSPVPASVADSAASAPPRRKTLKERLAEAARRGSSGGSVSSLASPPTSPVREPAPAPSPAAVLNGGGDVDGRKDVVASPEKQASALPATGESPAERSKEASVAEEKEVGKDEEKEDEQVVDGQSPVADVEELEESSFL